MPYSALLSIYESNPHFAGYDDDDTHVIAHNMLVLDTDTHSSLPISLEDDDQPLPSENDALTVIPDDHPMFWPEEEQTFTL